MNIPDSVKAGQPVEAATMNTLFSTVRQVRDYVRPRIDSGNDDTVSLHAFWADISMVTREDPDKPMQAVIEQAYVHNLSTGEKLPVFRHPLEQVKEFDVDDVFELVIYATGTTVNAVRFVEEGEVDFDLQTIADGFSGADAVPGDLQEAIEKSESENLSGEAYRVSVLKFIKPVVVEGDLTAEPPVKEVKQWDVEQYCKNDILWGGAGSGGSGCGSWELSVRYDAEKDIYYGRVGVGFHGYKRPDPFIKDGKDVSFYEVSLAGKSKSQQVGLRVPFKAMVSQTEYVLPTTLAQGTAVAEGEEPKPMTIEVEDFDNYRFDFDLPRDKEAEGDVVMPIGSFVQIKTESESESGAITTTESWVVGQQLVSCDNTGVFSPFAGYTIY